jgi:hypothetical protein
MRYELIAHRGGVVDRLEEENTLEAIDRAAEAGYYGVEIDVRRTKDGAVVLNHHPYFGDPVREHGIISDMTAEELASLAARLRRPVPPTIEEAAERCGGRLSVMLEVKEETPPADYFGRIVTALERHRLFESLLVIGSAAGLECFGACGALTCIRIREFRERASEGTLPPSDERFLFAHGNELVARDCRIAADAGMLVVPSVNTFHYRTEAPMDGARRDCESLIAEGITRFQIDSCFEAFFRDER